MVNRLFTAAVCLALLAILSLPGQVQAQAHELTVEPDRTRLYEGEVLTLTVKGSMKLDINLGNLFDFDMSNLPKPDIEKVTPNFEILAQNQQYSIRTLNSQMMGEITWTYQLAPNATGRLTIPALRFRDAVSQPVTVEVVDGTPPDQADPGRISFIELSADKDEVYVQEQLILTVRLFFRGNLIGGELSEPQHPHAIIESLGKQQEFSRYRDGVRYRVVERRYAVFPQRPGALQLPPIRFEGQARDDSGRLRFLRDSETLFELPVKDIPGQFSGNTWLPAAGLSLEESGLPPSMEVETGENMTREIQLTAVGLPAEALPPLPDAVPSGIRSYPEEPERRTETTLVGLTSSLRQSRALVPVNGGDTTLPAIRIHWWDTQADRERVAEIPQRTLRVIGTSATADAPESAPGPSAQVPDRADTNPVESTATGLGRLWPWLSLLFGLLWLTTAGTWWWSHRRDQSQPEPEPHSSERVAFERLLKAVRQGAPATTELLVIWANLQVPGRRFRSGAEVVDYFHDVTLTEALRGLQARLFAPDHYPDSWDGRRCEQALKRLRSHTEKHPETGLPPLYPEGLA